MILADGMGFQRQLKRPKIEWIRLGSVCQGLKPIGFICFIGTTEVVPFYKAGADTRRVQIQSGCGRVFQQPHSAVGFLLFHF
jgi:hypothetical protein